MHNGHPMNTLLRLARVKVVGIAIAACLIHQTSLVACTLNVPEDYQEQDQWCWAATSQAVLTYYGTNVTQSQIAQYGTDGADNWNWLYGSSTGPTQNGVDLILYYFQQITSTPYANALSQDVVRTEICTNARPVVIRWGWNSGGGHILAIRGLDNDGTTYLMDPWYGPTINTYSWVLSGSSHTWTHSLQLNVTPFQCWQIRYFGSTTDPRAAANRDADGTGQNNLFKYVAGLNPTNPASVFTISIASATNQPLKNALLFGPLAPGRTYTPQFSTNLMSGIWWPLNTYTGPVTNNGIQVSITDTNPIPPKEFYRLNISLP